eukprot:scaffold146_cov171-Ochromonas_danica.AAC.20
MVRCCCPINHIDWQEKKGLLCCNYPLCEPSTSDPPSLRIVHEDNHSITLELDHPNIIPGCLLCCASIVPCFSCLLVATDSVTISAWKVYFENGKVCLMRRSKSYWDETTFILADNVLHASVETVDSSDSTGAVVIQRRLTLHCSSGLNHSSPWKMDNSNHLDIVANKINQLNPNGTLITPPAVPQPQKMDRTPNDYSAISVGMVNHGTIVPPEMNGGPSMIMVEGQVVYDEWDNVPLVALVDRIRGEIGLKDTSLSLSEVVQYACTQLSIHSTGVVKTDAISVAKQLGISRAVEESYICDLGNESNMIEDLCVYLTAALMCVCHGSSGIELKTFLESYRLPQFNLQTFRQVLDGLAIDLYTPTAPNRSYSPANGEKMNVWFDRNPRFLQEGMKSQEDLMGINHSLDLISHQMKELEQKYEHFLLGGFSMGGGLSLHAFRKIIHPKLRAVFTMGSFLVEDSSVNKIDLIPSFTSIPLLMMHGEGDSLIRLSWGRQTATTLHLRGLDVNFRSYPCTDHEIGEEQMVDVLDWIRQIRSTFPSNHHPAEDKEVIDDDSRETTNRHYDSKTQEEAPDKDDSIDGLSRAMQKAYKEDQPGRSTLTPTPSACPEDCYPYFIEYESRGNKSSISPKVTIHYQVPEGYVPALTVRPILACGAAFEVVADSNNKNGVQVSAMTYDPEKTAQEIGRRLKLRMVRGSGQVNPCPMS